MERKKEATRLWLTLIYMQSENCNWWEIFLWLLHVDLIKEMTVWVSSDSLWDSANPLDQWPTYMYTFEMWTYKLISIQTYSMHFLNSEEINYNQK